MGAEENSYQRHQQSFAGTSVEKELAVYRNWFDKGTTDVWRHVRMLSVLDTFLKQDSEARWLTVGDGRFGTSAIYINRNNGKAIATDLDIRLLEVAKKESLLAEMAYANAEKLPYADNSFDYAYCKQAYHHFPRPALAVYEMLRVSKKAVIYTEPQDFVPAPMTRAFFQKLKHGLKKLSGKKVPHSDTGNFESGGNYVYGISVRDFEKIAMGLGLPAIAYKRFDDIYFAGAEQEVFSESASIFKKIKSRLRVGRIKAFLGLSFYNTIQMVVFKTEPTKNIENSLTSEGYTFVRFPANPYI